MQNCLFCQIIKGKIPADKAYEDDKYLAFYDINPQAPVHMLIIPKEHIDSLEDLEEKDFDLIGGLILTAKKVAKGKGINEDGYRLIINCGEHGGQIIKHLHVHLLGGKKLGPKVVL